VSASCDARLLVNEPTRRGFLFMLTFPFLADDLVIISEVDSSLGPASPFGFMASLSGHSSLVNLVGVQANFLYDCFFP
jgi:hypothetical protein